MNFVIRDATDSDFADIVYINEMSLGLMYGIMQAKERYNMLLTNDNHKIFVAETDNKVVGYIHLNINAFLYTDIFFNVNTLAVLTEFRKKNIGSMLLKKSEEYARDVGASYIRILLDDKNKKARKFLKKRCFSLIKPQYNMKNLL